MINGGNPQKINILSGGNKDMPRFRRSFRRPRRKTGNVVIHVPSTMDQNLVKDVASLIVISAPSIFAAGSASSNIEAQDKDRTVNVGHHIGRLNLDIGFRNMITDGIIEFCVLKVERDDSVPAIGTHPIPSSAEILSQGLQQACRMANPGKVFYFAQRAYTIEMPFVQKITVSPAKYKLSKCKAGDHWILILFNRGTQNCTFDYQGRFKEYE